MAGCRLFLFDNQTFLNGLHEVWYSDQAGKEPL
jgi:hypothetical protein